jgi:molybdopterin/thiamine biosynthesis adenylyltransferase
MIDIERYARHFGFFAQEGQEALSKLSVTVIGCSGLGSQVILILAYLGVKKLYLVEPSDLKLSSLNRNVCAWQLDPIPGTSKLDVAERLVKLVNAGIEVVCIKEPLESDAAFNAIKRSDYVFGCLDHDGPRSILNELCIAYDKVLIDLASDIKECGSFGGRVVIVKEGQGCLYCYDVLDQADVTLYLSPEELVKDQAAVYGVPPEALHPETGPSVIFLNGVIANLGVTEFVMMATGKREPLRHFHYYGNTQKIRPRKDHRSHCPCCATHGMKEQAGVERYNAI